MRGRIIRSRLQWLQQGEKPTKYFCSLENRNFVSKRMSFIEKDNGEILFDQKDIVNETKLFYESLYKKQTIECVN